ncbi:alpha/beta hydrolase [Paenibacillus sp. FSL H7-0357]|uniref:alpha/beta fold hydrolase n=1 Tax=unclassified Paenibacillus TaxID=185978 RepID=UPI0004F85CAF|nr:alpha/beta hydrolase [Paenibacillus sp. FSL H7-0357]AIQ18183.1 alpha/beta hydrolase [Paenibacillus sp. FSL H7-0357]
MTIQPQQPKKRSKKKIWKRVTLSLLTFIILLLGSGFAYEWLASRNAEQKYQPPGKLVDAGGYKLHINKLGQGSPTIILESGSGETSLSWRDIPEKLSEFATVVSYDRAGYAWSEKAPTARTGENIVRELHTALEREGIDGPYLLVGHSLGGMYARLFADTYRDEVAGMVLIDARPEDDERETKPILTAEKFAGNPPATVLQVLKLSGAMRIFQDVLLDGLVAKEDRGQFINVISKPSFFKAKEQEGNLAHTTEDAIRGQNLGSLPVRILSRGIPQDYAGFGFSEAAGKKLEDIWQKGQRKMLDLSTDSKQTVATHSGHMIIHDEPDLVIQTIRSLLTQLQSPSPQ